MGYPDVNAEWMLVFNMNFLTMTANVVKTKRVRRDNRVDMNDKIRGSKPESNFFREIIDSGNRFGYAAEDEADGDFNIGITQLFFPGCECKGYYDNGGKYHERYEPEL